MTPEIAKRRICSSATIDFGAFKASTYFHGLHDEKEKEKYTKMFLEVVEDMNNEDRQLLLKFMSGRTRL